MESIGIKYNGIRGEIIYDENDPKNFRIEHSDPDVVEKVTEFLNEKRKYPIPESGRIDDYRIVEAMPTDNVTFFELALNVLAVSTGVFITE